MWECVECQEKVDDCFETVEGHFVCLTCVRGDE